MSQPLLLNSSVDSEVQGHIPAVPWFIFLLWDTLTTEHLKAKQKQLSGVWQWWWEGEVKQKDGNSDGGRWEVSSFRWGVHGRLPRERSLGIKPWSKHSTIPRFPLSCQSNFLHPFNADSSSSSATYGSERSILVGFLYHHHNTAGGFTDTWAVALFFVSHRGKIYAVRGCRPMSVQRTLSHVLEPLFLEKYELK